MSERAAAVLLAGGSGSRIEQGINKVYLEVASRPLIAYSLETFDRSELVAEIVLVIRDDDRQPAEEVVGALSLRTPLRVVTGGNTRHESEERGLEALAGEIDSGMIDVVAIHDAARPFMTLDLLAAVVVGARRAGGAIPAMDVEEQLFRLESGLASLLDRSTLVKAQTPQAFRAGPLLAAYRRAREAGFAGVDTAETAERFSDLTTEVIPGDPRNLKVTYVEDLFRAEEHALAWKEGAWAR